MAKIFQQMMFWSGVAAGAKVAYDHTGEALSKMFGVLSEQEWAKNVITSAPVTKEMVDRFVAGDSAESALASAKTLVDQGFLTSLDLLGEDTKTRLAAQAAQIEICNLLDGIAAENLNSSSNISIKLTQLGLKLDPNLAYENMTVILDKAKETNNWVRIDMEESEVTSATIETFLKLRDAGYDNVGIVVQSYLYRTAGDVAKLVDAGSRVRLCKGAYNEPDTVAFPEKRDTDDNYIRLMQDLLSDEAVKNGVRPAIATHDDKIVEATLNCMRQNRLHKDAVEFQMLYGVRQDLQNHLLNEGYPVRIYIPFGRAWYPYFMRRLAERPANITFVLKNL